MDIVKPVNSPPSYSPFPLQGDLALAYASIESRFSTPPHILEPAYDAFIQEFLRESALYIEDSHQFSSQQQADLYLFVDQLIQNHITKHQETLDPLIYTHVKEISSNIPIPFLGRVALDQKISTPSPSNSLLSQNPLLDELITAIKLLEKIKNEPCHLSIQRRTLLFKLSKVLIPLILEKTSLSEIVALLEQLDSQDDVISLFFCKFRSVFKNEEENGATLDLLRRHLEDATEKDRFTRLLLWILERTMWWSSDKVQALREAKKLSSFLDLDWQGDYRWTLFKTAFLSGATPVNLRCLLDLLLPNQAPSVYLLFFQEISKLFIAYPNTFTNPNYLLMPIDKQSSYLVRRELHDGFYKIIQNVKEPTVATCRFFVKMMIACHIPGPQTNHTMTTLLRRMGEAAYREGGSLPRKDAIRSLFSSLIHKSGIRFQNRIAPYQIVVGLLKNLEEDAIRRIGLEVAIEFLFTTLNIPCGFLDIETTLDDFFSKPFGESIPIFIKMLFHPVQWPIQKLLFSTFLYKKLDQWIQKDEDWRLLQRELNQARSRLINLVGGETWRRVEAWIIKRSLDQGKEQDKEIRSFIKAIRRHSEISSTLPLEPKILFFIQKVKDQETKKLIVQSLHVADLAAVISLKILPFEEVLPYIEEIPNEKRKTEYLDVVRREKTELDRKEEEWIDLKTEEFVRLLKQDALQITIEAELLSLQAMEDEIRKEAALAELARQEKKHKI